MISRIQQISGVGRFKHYVPDPPIDLDKLTVVYGENGKGKSTLAAIFRSIAKGSLGELERRTTVGLDKKSVVICLDDGTKIAYSSPGQRWSQTINNLLVFDEAFVHENVNIGPLVDKEQRRNLNTVILGNTAWQLSQEEKDVKEAIKVRRDEITKTKQKIESRIMRPASNLGAPMSFDEYLQLQWEPGDESQLTQQKLLVDQLRSFSEVLSRREFAKVVMPEIPFDEIESLLKSSIEDVEANAEARVQAHFDRFSDGSLEDWIEQGTGYTSNVSEDCPYCGQPLQTSSLVKHYQAYFSEAYKALKSLVEELQLRRLQFRSEMDSANKAIADNAGISDLWRTEEIDGMAYPMEDFEELRRALDELLKFTKLLLAEKSNRPLEPIEFSAEFHDARTTWSQVCDQVTEHNRQRDENNERIRKHKQKLADNDFEAAELKLLELQNAEIRNSAETSSLCDKYSQLKGEQLSDNRRKDHIQARIKQEVMTTYCNYGKRVNELLRTLNADFTITNLKQRSDGTMRQAVYHIALMGAEIPVDGDKTAASGQSYKTTLSEGDRRTLALSLFLARLEALTKLDDKILVFDDPVTSMDDNRSSGTADLILANCEKVSQVIVLSHRKRFLRNFWIKYKRSPSRYGELRLLEISPHQSNLDYSDIRPKWDIARATETDFEEHVRYVAKYIRNSPQTHMRDAAMKLRLVLETHYQWLYQEEFDDDSKQFGDFIGKVMESTEPSLLYSLKKQDGLELRRLNEATSTFHHPAALDLEETELRQLCKDTLNLIGRRY